MFMRRFSAILLLLCFSLPAIAQESENSPELIRIDRNHSTMGFNVPIVKWLSKVTGKFTDFSIDLIWDEANLDASSVQLVIQVESIDTGIEARNKHLKTADFFDVEQFPTITFNSSSIQKSGDGFDVQGTYTMHGVSKEVTLPLTLKTFTSEEGQTWTAFRVNYVIDRTDYGMNWKHNIADFFVGNEIEADIVLLTR